MRAADDSERAPGTMSARGARARAALIAVATAGAVGALGSPAAHAGQYNVYYAGGNGCGMFAASATPGWAPRVCGAPYMQITTGFQTSFGHGSEENISTTAPPGITITAATTTYQIGGQTGQNGWGSGDFYSGGGQSWNSGVSPTTDSGIDTSRWGFQLLCSSSSGCSTLVSNGGVLSHEPPYLDVDSIQFNAVESQSPGLAPTGGANLLGHTSGYVWNPAGDPWSIAVAGSDPSGTCNITATVNGSALTVENQTPNHYAWQQCSNGSFPASLDTRQYASGSGQLAIGVQGTNAAGNASGFSRTIRVDNTPVQVSLATPNDANPTVWVNHAVQVTANATAGPSGIGATSCSLDGGQSFTYPTGRFTVDGTGAHTVSCTAANTAVDPQGQPNTGTASEQVKIDETPPTLSFAPVNPSNPDELAVNTSDGQSGVAGGSITAQGPHASAPVSVPTTLSGGQLLAHFNDGGKNGNYTFTATSCDAVGSCANTQEVLHFPIRLGSRGLISFHPITAPARTIRKRIIIGPHHRTVERREKIHGHWRRVKRTITVGRHRTVRVRIHVDRRCGHAIIHVRVGRHHRRHRRRVVACRRLRYRTLTHSRQHLGHRITLYGLLQTKHGRPLRHARVIIAARPEERGGRYHRILITHTDRHGRWQAMLPGGPSRRIRARYPGSHVLEPATAHAQLTVPAGIRLWITPHVLPWSSRMTVHGHLIGRYIPHDGVALRFLVRYPRAHGWTVLQALRTNRHGAFRFDWSYHGGRGVATYGFRIASTATETDFPYAAGASRTVRVTFGPPTPYQPPHHRHRHRHHRRDRRHRGRR